uniref:Uncharacterized protein n=1 Tax=Anguilla anguilla TaxID=7936 RepID=A0A0E9VGZ2_ANGAN
MLGGRGWGQTRKLHNMSLRK